jgi:hypothetical protein
MNQDFSDSTNPQSVTTHSFEVFDLLEFQGGTLFSAKLSKSYSLWLSRGGSSGFLSRVRFADVENSGWDTCAVCVGEKKNGEKKKEQRLLRGKETRAGREQVAVMLSCLGRGEGGRRRRALANAAKREILDFL